MDVHALARAYDRSADGYDDTFRPLQRVKYRAAAELLGDGALDALAAGGLALDAGAGTGLFAEWLADPAEPRQDVRATLRSLRWIALDASPKMAQRARARRVHAVVADLALPPLRPASCALAVAFTSLLEEKQRGLRALAQCLRRGGLLVATFLRAELPTASQLERWSGLALHRGPAEAGQDAVVTLKRSP